MSGPSETAAPDRDERGAAGLTRNPAPSFELA